MPITGIRLRHFKCYRDSGQIDLSPLTVIFGRNNSGKSSILQSILLLRQTLDNPLYGERLNLRGPLYDAGSFSEFVHEHAEAKPVRMQIDIESGLASEVEKGSIELEYTADREPHPPRLKRITIRPEGQMRIEIKRGPGLGGPLQMSIGDKILGLDREANFSFPVAGFLPVIGDEPRSVGRPNARRAVARVAARALLDDLEHTIRQLRAVGAFRQQPVRRHEYQGLTSPGVDLSGQHVISALISDAIAKGKARGHLADDTNRWLKLLGRVTLRPLKTATRGGQSYELRVQDDLTGQWANLADVGFGLGQAFPVLVEGLRTPVGGLFLVQEPEIHLHPDAQLAMADFLIELVTKGRRVIVETHSENMLLRLRRRLLDKSPTSHALVPDDVSLLYVEAREKGGSLVKRLPIDALGQVEGWPPGFLEDANRERMALLGRMAEALEE